MIRCLKFVSQKFTESMRVIPISQILEVSIRKSLGKVGKNMISYGIKEKYENSYFSFQKSYLHHFTSFNPWRYQLYGISSDNRIWNVFFKCCIESSNYPVCTV